VLRNVFSGLVYPQGKVSKDYFLLVLACIAVSLGY